jgi:hypothetical protein
MRQGGSSARGPDGMAGALNRLARVTRGANTQEPYIRIWKE